MRKSSVASASRNAVLGLACLATVVYACGPSRGEEGGACLPSASSPGDCNYGLLCNLNNCEKPGVQREGGLCTLDLNCSAGLVCNTAFSTPPDPPSGTCEAPHSRGVGEACASDDNCAASAHCLLEAAPFRRGTCLADSPPTGGDSGLDGGGDATADAGVDAAGD